MLIGELDPTSVSEDPGCVRGAGKETTARLFSDPGCKEALRRDEQTRLLVDLAYGAYLEALAGGETPRGGLPGTGGTPEQEHPAVRANRQDAGDQVCFDRQPLGYPSGRSGRYERSLRAAASGSSASSTARTTAKPGAPAPATARATEMPGPPAGAPAGVLWSVPPPMANQGMGTFSRATSRRRMGPVTV